MLLALAFASTASAARKQFEHFSADIPAGWKTKEVDGAVEIAAPDGSATLAVSLGEAGDPEAVGTIVMEALGGSDGAVDEDGDFMFSFEKDGAPGVGIVQDAGDFMVILVLHGDVDKLEPIIGSIED